MKKLVGICLISMIFFACKHDPKTRPHVIIDTIYGDIELELYMDKAPKTVSAFLSYIDSGYYDSSNFYRVLSEFNQPTGSGAPELIQGGLYRTDNPRKNLKGIPHENTKTTGLIHKNGSISMARLEPGTATTEFFICLGDQPSFDYGGNANEDGEGYAVFGQVVNGQSVVWKIYTRKEYNEMFTPPIRINSIRRKVEED